jgi:hypothetical protein
MRTAIAQLAAGGFAALTMLAAPGLAAAQVPTEDSVVASGFSGIFTNIDTIVRSGPSGENPTGHAQLDAAGQRFASASITCLWSVATPPSSAAACSRTRSASPASSRL